MSRKTWYVEALDEHTNEVIASVSGAEIPALNARIGVFCIDGRRRDLWECEYTLIAKLLKSRRRDKRLLFKVFYREGRYGPVRLWPFTNKKKLTLASARKKGLVGYIRV